jgi:hypothetical protein
MSEDQSVFGSEKKASVFIKKRDTSRPPSAGSNPSKYFSSHNYEVVTKKRNINHTNLKPSVYPSNNSSVDSYTQKKILSNMSSAPTVIPELHPNDGLQQTLLARLKTLEGQVANYRHQLLMKDAQVKELTNKMNKDSQHHGQVVSALKQTLHLLDEKRIPHNFSSFYGFVDDRYDAHETVAGPVIEQPKVGAEPEPEAGEENYPRLNMAVVIDRINALNNMVVQEQPKSYTAYSGGAQIKSAKPASCKIVFFKNGITVDGGPFRPYQWDITKALLNDIADGYFPYEFKEKHPDGIKLEAVDKSTQMYTKVTEVDKKMEQYSKAKGNVRDLNYLNMLTESEHEPKMDRETFLNQLPKSVVKNGKVIPIRSEISNMIGSPVDLSDVHIETECHREIAKNESDETLRKRSAFLKIKCPSTNQNFTVTMYQTETIGDLRRLLAMYLKIDFELRTTHPARVYSDESETLQAAKLLPKAAMYVVESKHVHVD